MFTTGGGVRNGAGSRSGRATQTTPRHGGSSVLFSDSGRTRSNFGQTNRSFHSRAGSRGHGGNGSATGFVSVNNDTLDRGVGSATGRRGGRRFNSGHGSVGAPFAGSLFINNNVSRYGRAYDRGDIFHDGVGGRSVGLAFSGFGSHYGGYRDDYGHGYGGHDGHGYGQGFGFGHDHDFGHGSHFDNSYYYSPYYYGRRHYGHHLGGYGGSYYPTYGYADYGYGLGDGGYGYPSNYVSSYPFTYPYTYPSTGVIEQNYYEDGSGVEQAYVDVATAPDTGTVYVPPVQPCQAAPAVSVPLAAPEASANQDAPQVEQIRIPQSVVDGHKAFAQHDIVKARRSYLTAVLADSDDGYAKLFYAMASMAAEDYDVASLALRGALRSTSELITDPIDLRQFYGDEDQVKADLDALVAFSSGHAADINSQLLLAYFHYSTGQAEAAQRVLKSVGGEAIEKDATLRELRDAMDAVVIRSQKQSSQDKP